MILVPITFTLKMTTQSKKTFNLDNFPYEIAEAIAGVMDGFHDDETKDE